MVSVTRCDMCGAEIRNRNEVITVRVGRHAELDFDTWACVHQFVQRQMERHA
jgi:hypothetical protein